VIALHSRTTYRVYVVGFVPGFPYMASVDQRLALPRRATPRTRVPAGSVAIAAGQTGIYPSETPGGWHLIGRTPLKAYDAARDEPFAFKPGDRVRFHAIDRDTFRRDSPWR
jgi:KipI family sensor histidine kinase inhibitor